MEFVINIMIKQVVSMKNVFLKSSVQEMVWSFNWGFTLEDVSLVCHGL